MANLQWKITPSRGSVDFGRLIPLTGSTYGIDVTGGEVGKTYAFYVMDDDAKVCLASSTYANSAYSIAFNTTELRSEFERDWHEVRQFHTIVSDGTNTIAEGDLSITWNPGWTDASTGSVYSFKGPKGDTGVGISSIAFLHYDASGNSVYKFTLTDSSTYNVVVRKGDDGTGILRIDANGTDSAGNAKYNIVLSNGSTYPILCPKGPIGPTGVGISAVTITADDLLKITYTNGSEWTSSTSIRGPQGSQGNQGVGITRIDDAGLDSSGNHKYTIVLSNNSTYQIVCPKGPLGNTGNGIASMALTADYKIRVTYTSGSTWTSDSVRGPQGERGPMGDGSYIFDASDSKWHNVSVYTDEFGEKTIQVNPVGTDTRPGAQSLHAASHRTGGTDAITPFDIGAANASHASSHGTGGSDALTPADIGAAASSHKTSHATGGSDAITPADIGAQAALSFDTMPTDGSTNPVTSNGIHDFVNSSIATNTANYISNNGEPFASVAALEAYAGVVTNNDYAFVTGTDAQGNSYFDRYKATISGNARTWAKEYRLNNSSFTAAQWAAISSGITSGKVSTYDGYAAQIAGKAASVHTHTKSQITDFPSTMTPKSHASSHGTGGSDALTASSIGAASATDLSTHTGTANIHVPIVVVSSEPSSPSPGTIYFITES